MIDWQRVNDLRAELGSEDFREIVTIFREEVEEVIARLLADPQPERLAADLHFLKGSALNLGFERFSELCQDGERLAETGRADSVRLSELSEVYELSLRELIEAASF